MIKGVATDQVAEESRANSVLWQLPNVVVTPSTAGQFPSKTYFYKNRVCPLFLNNYKKFVTDEEDAMENRVL
jgi:phosphoglycerate dehydrogenase-like enzyme